jgi:hypothetical protein
MTANFENSYGDGYVRIDVTAEKDLDVFLSIVGTAGESEDDFLDVNATDHYEIAEFFRMVDQAKADYIRLSGKTL